MRPIERGPIPQDKGQNKVVTDHKDWRADLIKRLGPYCSYCEMRLNDSPQVEHVVPKTPVPALALEWSNMLLACGACNSRKNDELCDATSHFLPDAHNTYLAFTYRVVPHPAEPLEIAAQIIVNPALNPAQQTKALATIEMCGLANIPLDRKGRNRASDLRWKYRYEEMLEAKIWRQKWNAAITVDSRITLIECVQAITKKAGFFSVWFSYFHDVPEVKQALLQVFPNTASCFPAPNFDPIPRITGDL